MENGSQNQIVSDAETFCQLSAAQRVITVFRMNGRTEEQIKNLMGRYSHIGVLVNNLATCRDPKLKAACVKHRAQLEAELMVNLPPEENRIWTPLEELDITIAVAGDSVAPPRLKQAFKDLNKTQAAVA